jgi:anti-anti-sigma regulatory factor
LLNLKKEQQGNVLIVQASGVIDENADFSQLVSSNVAEIRFSTKDVSRINSVGVRGWINAFQKITAKNVKVTLFECSTVIVEQLNMIVNFAAGMTVESVMVPFSCTKCRAASVGLFKSDDLKAINFEVPDIKCPSCSAPASFDDIPEEYFHFLTR